MSESCTYGVRKTLETPVTRAISDARQIQINLPRLVIFDLDATLWEPEMYQLRSAPSAWDPQSGGVQAGSQLVKLYPEAKEVLDMLLKEPKFREVKIAAASSTTEPEWAQLCMSLFKLDGGVAMDSLFSNTQIYPIHNKATHIHKLHEQMGINFSDMLFFDDCTYGDNCGTVRRECPGVTALRTPNGLTMKLFEQGIEQFRRSANQ